MDSHRDCEVFCSQPTTVPLLAPFSLFLRVSRAMPPSCTFAAPATSAHESMNGYEVSGRSDSLRASRHDLSIIRGRDGGVMSTGPCKPATRTCLTTSGSV